MLAQKWSVPAPIGVPRRHLLPLPLGEVAECSEAGEGKSGCNALSVTFGDSSPKGGAKGGCIWERKMERIGNRYAPFTLRPP